MARNTNQSSDFDFTVKQVEVLTPKGQPSGFFANYREDNDTFLGVTSQQYGLIQNGALLAAAETALAQRGMTGFERKVIVTGDGARMFAEYVFKDITLKNAVGDVFGYKLVVQNSFDRTLRAALTLGFLRLICLNGAATLEKELALTRKHSMKITVDFVGGAIDSAFSRGEQALSVFNQLAQVSISDEQGLNILGHFEQQKILSGSLKEAIAPLWLAPRREEDKPRNVYSLWNAATEHLTHGVSNERFEYAGKVTNAVLMALVNAVKNPTKLATLILPVPENLGTQITVDV